MSEIEPPPNDLKDLFAAEKAAPTINEASRAALRSRLAASVGRTPLGHAAAGSALGGGGKALAVIALTLAAGGGTVIAVRHATSSETSAKQPATPRNVAPVPSPILVKEHEVQREPAEPVRAVPAAQPQEAQRLVHSAEVPKVTAQSTTATEPELLKRAWTALSAGEPERALEITHQDALLHPDGVLAEEREATRITALAKLHRMDEARSAAARFIQDHPASVHRALVERAIQREETP